MESVHAMHAYICRFPLDPYSTSIYVPKSSPSGYWRNHVTIHIVVVTKLASCIGMHIRRWRWDCSPTESNPNSKNSNNACTMSKPMADWWCYHLFDLHQAKQTKTKVLSSTGSSWVRLLQLYHSIFQIEQTKEKQSRYDIAGLISCSQIKLYIQV